MKAVIALCVALSVAAPLLAQSLDIGSPPGKLVDVGGRKVTSGGRLGSLRPGS